MPGGVRLATSLRPRGIRSDVPGIPGSPTGQSCTVALQPEAPPGPTTTALSCALAPVFAVHRESRGHPFIFASLC